MEVHVSEETLREMENIFKENDVEVETVQNGNKDIRGCIACHFCATKGKCVFDDVVNELAPKFERLNESGKITMELSKKNIYIHSISVTSESMEDYFLRLTGDVDHV